MTYFNDGDECTQNIIQLCHVEPMTTNPIRNMNL